MPNFCLRPPNINLPIYIESPKTSLEFFLESFLHK